MRHLVIGACGSMGRRHISILRQLCPNDEIVTVDNNGEADYEKPLVNLIEGSLVYICTPTRWHQIMLNHVVKYSPAGIFIEKPLFSRGEFRYASEPSEFNFPIAVAYQYRYHPLFRELKKNVADIFSYHIYASDSVCERYNDGAMETLLAHPIATAHWLFGSMREPLTWDNQFGAKFSAMSKSGVAVTMAGNFISGQRISLCVLGVLNREEGIHEQRVLNVVPDENMYVEQMKAWLNYVETGDRGELCGWDEALKIQELLR